MSAIQQVDQRRNACILSFTLLVVMLGFGLVIRTIPYYVVAFGAGDTELGLWTRWARRSASARSWSLAWADCWR